MPHATTRTMTIAMTTRATAKATPEYQHPPTPLASAVAPIAPNITRVNACVRYMTLALLGISASATAQNYVPENKPDNAWSAIQTPSGMFSEAIGSYANGCMTGAKTLPESGEGFVDMRRNRNRYYGQPRLIHFIHDLGRHTSRRYGRKHLIGDLSQPRGGRMNFGHSSHQIGLDVDIWMQTIPNNAPVNPYRDMRTTIDKATGVVLNGGLPEATRDALYFSATHPDVARIFVNPVIKLHLCQTERDTSWLRPLRPWWGHDEHFHVRLHCAPDNPNCINQNPPPAGDGCNEGLYDWVQEQSDRVNGRYVTKKSSKKSKKKAKTLPEQCQILLTTQ